MVCLAGEVAGRPRVSQSKGSVHLGAAGAGGPCGQPDGLLSVVKADLDRQEAGRADLRRRRQLVTGGDVSFRRGLNDILDYALKQLPRPALEGQFHVVACVCRESTPHPHYYHRGRLTRGWSASLLLLCAVLA
jgi:hypothetical protein